MSRRKRSSNVDPDIIAVILNMRALGYSGAAITRAIAHDQELRSRAPSSESTVRAILRRYASVDQSGEWSLQPALEVDSAAALDVIRWLVEWSGGRSSSLTNAEAGWVTSITHAAPSIPASWAYWIAREYIRRAEKGGSAELSRVLVMRAWENESDYVDAVGRNLVPRLPVDHFVKVGDGTPVSESVEIAVQRSIDVGA